MRLQRLGEFSIVSYSDKHYLFWGERIVGVVLDGKCYIKAAFAIPTALVFALTTRAGIDYAFNVVSVEEFYRHVPGEN